ncbi:hypothetical protein ACFWBF_01875 [Streptomyces sp. NPDC060028]|uniref:hypothetical protein n=1 Tax=Streptomyces sp. NPDC060028 TaxID=3347041 RepID=UPI00367D6E28
MSGTDPVLPAPAVAEADDDGLINPADALSGVNVTIPAHADFTAGDHVQVYWGDQGTSVPYTVPQGEGDKPVTLTIPWDTIRAADGGPTTPVHYRITRAGGGAATSEPIEVNLQQS